MAQGNFVQGNFGSPNLKLVEASRGWSSLHCEQVDVVAVGRFGGLRWFPPGSVHASSCADLVIPVRPGLNSNQCVFSWVWIGLYLQEMSFAHGCLAWSRFTETGCFESFSSQPRKQCSGQIPNSKAFLWLEFFDIATDGAAYVSAYYTGDLEFSDDDGLADGLSGRYSHRS